MQLLTSEENYTKGTIHVFLAQYFGDRERENGYRKEEQRKRRQPGMFQLDAATAAAAAAAARGRVKVAGGQSIDPGRRHLSRIYLAYPG